MSADTGSGNGATKIVSGDAPEDIEAVVEEEMARDISPDESRIRTYLENIINADPALIEDEKGNVRPTREWPPRERSALVRISRNATTGHANVQFNDRIKAIEQLARLNGMYDGTSEHRDPFTVLLESVPRAILHEIMAKLRAVADAAEPTPVDETDETAIDPGLAIVSRETSIAATVAVEPNAAADEDMDFV